MDILSYVMGQKSGGSTDDSFAKLIDRSIVTAVIPDGVTSIGSAVFRQCTSLRNVIIPNSVTNIDGSAFYECTNLESITIPDSVINVGKSMFTSCTNLKTVYLSKNITEITASMFQSCSSLVNITIPDKVTKINSTAFSGCTSLTTIICNATAPPELNTTALKNVPADCAIYVPAESVDAYKAASQWSARASYIQAIVAVEV